MELLLCACSENLTFLDVLILSADRKECGLWGRENSSQNTVGAGGEGRRSRFFFSGVAFCAFSFVFPLLYFKEIILATEHQIFIYSRSLRLLKKKQMYHRKLMLHQRINRALKMKKTKIRRRIQTLLVTMKQLLNKNNLKTNLMEQMLIKGRRNLTWLL